MAASEDSTFQKKVQKLLTKSWKRLSRQVSAVDKNGAVEAIHELRVATRRLRELVEIGADAVPGSVRRVSIQKLRRARRLCGATRNLDVLLELIAARIKRRTSEAELWAPIQRDLESRRESGLKSMRKAIDRLDLPSLQQQWQKGIRSWAKAQENGSVVKARRRLDKHLAKRLGQFARARDLAKAPEAKIADVHRLRLTGKRLRYVLEAVMEVNGESLAETLEHLRAFQVCLGEWNDLDMLAEVLIEHCSRKRFVRSDPGNAQRLLGVLRNVRERQESKLKDVLALADEIPGLDKQLSSSR
ncbi:CHAD domain-containing protein [Candidatus Sumerlaeota bacterium]|nr:CHAD domain-containing protein [Candidatus Sumerlaeota bacterium]